MKKIVFATYNKNKLAEIKEILKDMYEVIGLDELGFHEEIEETGSTLFENASIKSKTIFNRFGIDCFSDDTGLMVDSLDGAPGVYSARYAGEEGNADKNIEKLLEELRVNSSRKAHFSTVISLIVDGEEHFFEGRVDGEILEQRKGEGGFGYDPVFKPDGYSITFSEMDSNTKNSISHRGRAVMKLVDFLKSKNSN